MAIQIYLDMAVGLHYDEDRPDRNQIMNLEFKAPLLYNLSMCYRSKKDYDRASQMLDKVHALPSQGHRSRPLPITIPAQNHLQPRTKGLGTSTRGPQEDLASMLEVRGPQKEVLREDAAREGHQGRREAHELENAEPLPEAADPHEQGQHLGTLVAGRVARQLELRILLQRLQRALESDLQLSKALPR